MSETKRPSVEVEGAAAPPRRNGELVFQEPWEGRAFGLAVALRDQGLFPWEVFRTRLIAAIAASQGHLAGVDRPEYYENWLAALRKLLVEHGILTTTEIDERAKQFASGERDIVHPGAHTKP